MLKSIIMGGLLEEAFTRQWILYFTQAIQCMYVTVFLDFFLEWFRYTHMFKPVLSSSQYKGSY